MIKDVLYKLLALDAEIEYVEFKEAKISYSADKMGKYFSAISNEANLNEQHQGWMVFGIKDDRTIIGTNMDTRTINNLKNEIGSHTSPRMNFTKVHKVNTKNGKVLMFEIPKSPLGQVVSWKGHAYGRDGESLVGLQDQKRERIKNQILKDWSVQIAPSAGIKDLSKSAILKAREEYKEKHKHLSAEVDKWDDITFLNKSKVAIRGKLTNAAIILLGKPESEHFINPATCKISWVLQDKDGITKDYSHFSCPLILAVNHVANKIRNLKYRYIVDGSLFPQEVDQYDPYLIREALHNCISHQDYTKGGKINVVEKENGMLIFSNMGEFIPLSVEKVVTSDTPEERYRNKFLADAMVAFGMIDTVGSGIKRMFLIQKEKFFPLPDYDTSDQKVTVKIIGKVLDMNYARKLAIIPDLSLADIILLDKIVKGKKLTVEQAKLLKTRKLIEGRKPNYYISSQVADVTGERGNYIKMRGLKDDHYKKMVIEYIEKYEVATRKDIENLLMDILPSVLSKNQKKNKVNNIIYAMSRKDEKIVNIGTSRLPKWIKK